MKKLNLADKLAQAGVAVKSKKGDLLMVVSDDKLRGRIIFEAKPEPFLIMTVDNRNITLRGKDALEFINAFKSV